MALVAVKGGPLAYDISGKGETVIFVSGLGGTGSFWSEQIARLSGSFSVVTYDHRGVGRSAGEPPYSVAQWAEDLLAVLDATKTARAHLVGHSTGGVVAQAFAAKYRDRVRTLTLSGSWLKPDQRFRDLFALRMQVLEKLGGDSYRLLGDLLASSESSGPSSRAIAAPGSLLRTEVILGRIKALLDYDGSAIAPHITHPTLVLASNDDYIVPAYLSADLAAAISSAKLVAFASGGHFFPRTRPDDYNNALTAFFTQADHR